ncbi:MAG TPA: lipopolysaccharide heptosyltransferase II [Gemmataceae bacterium]|nr:lipopolysaccharide heptosyltransferase II [Gemmataceae bacterium]
MNVAVFLPNWIGDAVMATPALRALRGHYTEARLIGVMKPYVADVFAGGDWFDEILFAHGGPWSQGVLSVAWQLRRRRIDVVVLLTNTFRSALTAWLSGCRRRIGYARYGRSLLLTDALPPLRDELGRRKPSPILDAYNLLAERAGCPHPTRLLELFTTSADERAADQVWKRGCLEDYSEVVCLNSGAAFGSAKHWPSAYFADLARRLAEERGSGVLVLCGPNESELARDIATQACHANVQALSDLTAPVVPDGPRLSLGLTKACVRRADLLVTTDSGPRHFAAAFDRPVVTLFGPTHIEWTETYHPRAVHLQKRVECGPCQLRVCPLDHRCMLRLTPDEAYTAAEGLLH